MKLISLLSRWVLGWSLLSLAIAVQWTDADPTDDFSFSLGASNETEVYRLLSEDRIAEILSDRLDLFPRSEVPRLASHLFSLCKKYRFDPTFILSLIEVESGFRIKAVSPVRALGLMQLMAPTALFVVRNLPIHLTGFERFTATGLEPSLISAGKDRFIMDPYVNTTLGIAYLGWLRDYYKGQLPYHLLAAYNVGPGRLDELLARKTFQPVETKKYFHAIRRGVPEFRFYQRISTKLQMRRKKKPHQNPSIGV